MIENVRGILGPRFENYRLYIGLQLKKLGYESGWQLLNASDFGVSQFRPRAVFVAIAQGVLKKGSCSPKRGVDQ